MKNECNWMMFVGKARNHEEQNLVAYPHDGKIYFFASQDTPPENNCFSITVRILLNRLVLLNTQMCTSVTVASSAIPIQSSKFI